MKPVTVIGGGFSGLATAYYLTSRSIPVRVVERSDRLGGLIATTETPHGPAESAANGILNSRRVEDLFSDIDLHLHFPKATAKARYIFRGQPRRWPLSVGESLRTVGNLAGTLITQRRFGAKPLESLGDWGNRVVGPAATNYVLAPAVQGIYGTTPENLSAKLILPQKVKGDRPRKKGIVAPPRGMGDLIVRLREVLEAKGVEFELQRVMELESPGDWTVVCTSAHDASTLLGTVAPETSRQLASIKRVSIVKATVFLPESGPTGFGILFPKSEGFQALGVLFNTDIFENRGTLRSETWMFEGSGASGPWVDATDEEVIAQIVKERTRFVGKEITPESHHVKRWHQALPRYSTALEAVLARPFELPERVFLVGNYVSGIGLAKILRRADVVAGQVAKAIRAA